MRSLCLLLLSVVSLGVNAQKKVTINGTFPRLKDGTKVYLVPNTSAIKWRDSTTVKNGNFHFTLAIPEAFYYSLRLSREPRDGGLWQDFYVDEGSLNIKGPNENFNNISTSGSQYAVDYNSYLKWLAQQGITSKVISYLQRYAKAVKINDTLLGPALSRESKVIDSQKAASAREWVKNHPASAVSAYILFTDVGSKVSLADMETSLNALLPEARQDYFAKRLQAKVDGSKITAVGKMAPGFTQADTSGNPISLQNFKGKYLLIDFWASWCVPCRAENPNVVAAFKEYQEKGFTVLSISLDNDKEKWRQAIVKDNLPWTHVSDLKSWDNAVARLYDVNSIPYNLLLDPTGKIVAKNLRGDELDKTIAGALGVSPKAASSTIKNNLPPPPPPPNGL